MCGVWCGFECEIGYVGCGEFCCLFVVEWFEYVD